MPPVAVKYLLLAMWLVFVAYWVKSAFGVKKNIWEPIQAASMIARLSVLAIGIYVFASGLLNPFYDWLSKYTDHPSLFVQVIGLVLTAAGISVAIWARAHLGRNWSSVPVLKEGHELVTSGPYRYVRHPIYAGALLALLGSAMAGGVAYVIIFALFLCLSIYRVFAEDRLMAQRFPETYPAYRKRTKALIPFVV